ncbi:hydrophobin 1 [Earliella scabrosa]|nr:hydrophobin 1 [Earliella scabrosa]
MVALISAILPVALLLTSAGASVVPRTDSPPQCNTGPLQCCDSVMNSKDKSMSLLLGLLGVVVQGVDALVGIECNPINVIGLGGAGCNSNVVCCQNNNVGGLISIGCAPVIL